MRLATRLRTLERCAGAEARQAALCGVCGGLGRYNARTFVNGVPENHESPDPCPGCGEVRLVHIHLTVCDRITCTAQPLVIVERAA